VVIAHAAVTLVLVGLILTIQIVHYPLFDQVGPERFAAYEARHSARISALVMPLMPAELALALWLRLFPPAVIPGWAVTSGLALVGAIWLSTFLLQVPRHGILARGWDPHAHRSLVRSNWIRTAAWCARGALAVWWLFLI
jgi:hypothetical protein